ncbi:general transcription factor II-I repeat domain-containing protein 2B-like [Leuresthes tenuis]|uniref:general transcription factor II-I repeat domain-containing protein 2B-like n=1 Tax=Leuresthes tenuis TaxID=355514 RepID=UPI003B513FC0
MSEREQLRNYYEKLKSANYLSRSGSVLQSTSTASFVAALEIIKRGKPFTDGEYMKESFMKISEHLFSDFKNKREIIQKIREMPLSAKTVRDRAIKMAENISSKQIVDINSAEAFSIACDESSDVNDVEQTALLCRYVNSDGPQEELIELIPLKGQTRGQDICDAVLSCLEAKGINTTHLVSVSTDGAPCMRGTHKGFVNLLQKSLGRELMMFHCILHPEALCAQTFPPDCGSDESRYQDKEVDYAYSNLLLRNKVRWLSRGEVLKCFSTCLEHVKTFLESKGLSYPELEDLDWLVDMTSHLNTLNKNLQGKGSTALQMLEDVLAFERKMTVFARDAQKAAFGERFSDFRKEKPTLSFPVTLLDIDPSLLNTVAFTGVSKPDLEIELADIADKDLWVNKFKSLTADIEEVARQKATLVKEHKWSDMENFPHPDKLVFETWSAIPDTYINMKKYAFGVLSIFGSTYLCEQLFSSMNFIKNKHRSRLADESLQACMKISHILQP